MIIGVLGDKNLPVEYSPEDKMIRSGVISIIGVDTIADAIEKCQNLFLSFTENAYPDQVLIREMSYDEDWCQPPVECVSCGYIFMTDSDPSFCPGCGKKVTEVIRRIKE